MLTTYSALHNATSLSLSELRISELRIHSHARSKFGSRSQQASRDVGHLPRRNDHDARQTDALV